MWHPETDGRSGTGQALVLHGTIAERASPSLGGRPLAGFLAQLIVSTDPTLTPSRAARTQKAAARYAEAARVRL